jgi:hypothetical protein
MEAFNIGDRVRINDIVINRYVESVKKYQTTHHFFTITKHRPGHYALMVNGGWSLVKEDLEHYKYKPNKPKQFKLQNNGI